MLFAIPYTRTWGRWSVTRDNGELRLALRLLERNLPWVRNVFIVSTGGAAPDWLAPNHPRAIVVDADALVPIERLYSTHAYREQRLRGLRLPCPGLGRVRLPPGSPRLGSARPRPAWPGLP